MDTRRLTFAVGTGLLTASLATGTVGCKKGSGPESEQPHVNEGPEPTEIVNPVPDEEDSEDDLQEAPGEVAEDDSEDDSE